MGSNPGAPVYRRAIVFKLVNFSEPHVSRRCERSAYPVLTAPSPAAAAAAEGVLRSQAAPGAELAAPSPAFLLSPRVGGVAGAGVWQTPP